MQFLSPQHQQATNRMSVMDPTLQLLSSSNLCRWRGAFLRPVSAEAFREAGPSPAALHSWCTSSTVTLSQHQKQPSNVSHRPLWSEQPCWRTLHHCHTTSVHAPRSLFTFSLSLNQSISHLFCMFLVFTPERKALFLIYFIMCILLLFMHVYICGCSKLQAKQRRSSIIYTQINPCTFHSAKHSRSRNKWATKRNHANNGALSSEVFIFNMC